MKNHILIKFLAIVLAACCMLLSIASGVGIAVLISVGLYDNSVEDLQQARMRNVLESMAEQLAAKYAAANLSNCPVAFVEQYYGDWYEFQLSDPNLWYYTLEDASGQILDSNYVSQDSSIASVYEYVVSPTYPVILAYSNEESTFYSMDPYGIADAPVTEPTVPVGEEDSTPTEVSVEYFYREGYGWEDENGDYHYYTLGFQQGPVYLVTIHVLPGAYAQDSSYEWELLQLAYGYRYKLFLPLVIGLALFALLLVYLCCAAGRKPRSQTVRAGGMNMLPLDLYGGVLATGGFLMAALAWMVTEEWLFEGGLNWGAVWLTALLCFLVCLLIIAFVFAVAAQTKMGGGYWWRHSVVGTALTLVCRLVKWFITLLLKGGRKVYAGVAWLYSSLPLIWQWLLTGGILLILLVTGMLSRNLPYFALVLFVCGAVVLYGAYCFGTLLRSAREMSQGNLNQKVSEKGMAGSFREFAGHLNALAGVAVLAAQKQMKSERMKAELVTNVSHDIKTPLTSIINYVDLLQKAETPQQTQEYLMVLDRQSQRLKKLIDDLMDMSKASTGNMAVEITKTDAAEAVTQALGEFSDKLAAADLTPVFNPPVDPLPILADGRLTWRVLSNLLSNAVKYAMPGTRLYVDLVKLEGNVLISLKNISAQPLNVSSEELMERFVRGDASRNTEGSGLGLNIAQSLMDLQHGKLRLLIDGDLFKATLIFPSA